MINLSGHNLIVLIAFPDPKNLYLDTKIIALGPKVHDLQSFEWMDLQHFEENGTILAAKLDFINDTLIPLQFCCAQSIQRP